MSHERYLPGFDELEIKAPLINFTAITPDDLAVVEYTLRIWVIREAKNGRLADIHSALAGYHTLVLMKAVEQGAHDRIRAEAYEIAGLHHLNTTEA